MATGNPPTFSNVLDTPSAINFSMYVVCSEKPKKAENNYDQSQSGSTQDNPTERTSLHVNVRHETIHTIILT